MSHTLERMRDELAEGVINEPLVCSPQYIKEVKAGFRLGWEAAIKALEQEAGAFDEDACTIAMCNVVHERYRPDLAFRDGARFQYESDRARIGLAQNAKEVAVETLKRAFLKETELEARLAESEALYQDLYEITHKQMNADGKRIKELEAHVSTMQQEFI